MFDDQGIYHTETFNQPQTGAAAILDILNQPQSYQNAQKAQARKSEADIANQATEGEKHGQDFSQYPEYQSANDTLGISQDTAQGIFGNIPQQKLKAALAAAQAAKGDEPLDEDDVSKVYLAQGVTPPTSYLNSSAKKEAATERADTAFGTQALKTQQGAEKAAWESGLATQKEARQAGIDALRAHYATQNRDIPDGAEDRWAAYVASGSDQKNPKAVQGIATSASREQKNLADVDWTEAKVDTSNAMRDPTVAAEWAKAGLEKARTGLLGIQTSLAQMKEQNGGLTAAGAGALMKNLVGYQKQIADATDPNKHLMDGPAQKALAQKVAKQAQASMDATKAMLGPLINPAAQAGALQAQGGAQPAKPTFKSPEDVMAAVKAGKLSPADATAIMKKNWPDWTPPK